jgi:hypothetical protein
MAAVVREKGGDFNIEPVRLRLCCWWASKEGLAFGVASIARQIILNNV